MNTTPQTESGIKLRRVSGLMSVLILGTVSVAAIELSTVLFNESGSTESSRGHSVADRIDFGFSGLTWPHLPKFMSFIGPPKAVPLAFTEVLRLIQASAGKHNVPAEFVSSIIAAESNFNSEALSPKGAIGLMQLMPATARQYGANPSVPDQNVDAGTHYLRVLMDRYHSHGNSLTKVIAAYNAGPGMVDKYRGVPPFRETRGYVGRVLAFMHRFGGSTKG